MIQVVWPLHDETSPATGPEIGSQDQTRITENEKAGKGLACPSNRSSENHTGWEL